MSLAPLPIPTRVLVILQLCVIFSILCVSCASPFLQEHLVFKRELGLLKTIMGHQDLTLGLSEEEINSLAPKLQRHAARFALIPSEEQRALQAQYQKLVNAPSHGWIKRFGLMGRQLFIETPAFLQGYIVFSLLLCFALLFRVEGSARACLILPLLLFIYTCNNQYYGSSPKDGALLRLLPTEEELITRYVPEGLLPNITLQYQQLSSAWENYLIEDWAKEEPSKSPTQHMVQVEAGEFRFNIALLQTLASPNERRHLGRGEEVRGSGFLQSLALAWTIVFALGVNRRRALDLIEE